MSACPVRSTPPDFLMISLTLALTFFVGVAVAFVAVATYRYIERPPCVTSRVVVRFRDPQTPGVTGVLWTTRGKWLVLRDSQSDVDGRIQRVDGEVLIPRDRVLYIQRLVD